jgi:hypothetical protein
VSLSSVILVVAHPTLSYSAISFGDNSTAIWEIAALVDPLTEVGQKWASVLEVTFDFHLGLKRG